LILNNLPEIEKLFKLYLSDQCSSEDVQLLMHYFELDENENALKTLIREEMEKPETTTSSEEEQAKTATDRIFQNIKKNISKK